MLLCSPIRRLFSVWSLRRPGETDEALDDLGKDRRAQRPNAEVGRRRRAGVEDEDGGEGGYGNICLVKVIISSKKKEMRKTNMSEEPVPQRAWAFWHQPWSGLESTGRRDKTRGR